MLQIENSIYVWFHDFTRSLLWDHPIVNTILFVSFVIILTLLVIYLTFRKRFLHLQDRFRQKSIELKLFKTKMEIILANTCEYIFIVDENGKILESKFPLKNKLSGQIDDYKDQMITDVLSCNSTLNEEHHKQTDNHNDCFVQNIINEVISTQCSIYKKYGEVYLSTKENFSKLNIEVSAALLSDIDTVHVLFMFNDISEKTLLQEEIKNNENKIKIIFNTLPCGMLLTDAQSHIVIDANVAACQLIKTSANIIKGQKLTHFFLNQQISIDQSDKVDNREDILICYDDTNVPVLRITTEILTNNTPCILDTFVDITLQKGQQQQIKATLDQSERLNKLMIGREMQIVKMKKEINELLTLLGRPTRYSSFGAGNVI